MEERSTGARGIVVSHESERGCGYRKVGGLYLMADAPNAACGKMPLRLDVCPTCSAGIKPSRSWTWVEADALFGDVTCTLTSAECMGCPLNTFLGRAGLLWIGEKFYPRPDDFLREAARQGVSRRIPAVPKGFELGKTYVLLAHRKTIPEKCRACAGLPFSYAQLCETCKGGGSVFTPGIFQVFRPSRLEKVVTGEEPDEEIEALHKRGITPVKVVPLEEASA